MYFKIKKLFLIVELYKLKFSVFSVSVFTVAKKFSVLFRFKDKQVDQSKSPVSRNFGLVIFFRVGIYLYYFCIYLPGSKNILLLV